MIPSVDLQSVVVTCPDDQLELPSLPAHVSLASVEFVLTGILQHKLQLKKFQFKAKNNASKRTRGQGAENTKRSRK